MAVDPPPFVLRAVPLRDVSARFQESLVNALPTELVLETSNNWGHQAEVPSIQGVKLIHVMRNHGDWEKARVVTRKLPKHLWVAVSDLQALDDNRVAFTVHLVTPATVELDRQTWQNGIQIYSGHVRARFQLTGAVTMEATLTPSPALPTDSRATDAEAREQSSSPAQPSVFGELLSKTPAAKEEAKKTRSASLRVTRATFTCQDFVAENFNGLGGDLARLAGTPRKFQSWQPAMLREFQKPVLSALQTASAASELCASLSLMVAQVLATRHEDALSRPAARRGAVARCRGARRSWQRCRRRQSPCWAVWQSRFPCGWTLPTCRRLPPRPLTSAPRQTSAGALTPTPSTMNPPGTLAIRAAPRTRSRHTKNQTAASAHGTSCFANHASTRR